MGLLHGSYPDAPAATSVHPVSKVGAEACVSG
jgi:hypothetical protein